MAEALRLFHPDDEPARQTPRRARLQTVQAVVDWYKANDVRDFSAKAHAERLRILALFVEEYGTRQVDDLIGADHLEFLNRHQPKSSKWTRKRWSNTIKRPFNFVAGQGLCVCPLSFVKASVPRGGHGRDLTRAEFCRLARLATPAFRPVLIFLRYSGARPFELRQLEWSQVREAAKVAIQKAGSGKNRNNRGEQVSRKIFLSGRALRLLTRMRARARPGDKYVFLNSFGKPWTCKAVDKNLAGLREKLNLPADAKVYGCRHAFATNAILNGVDMASLKDLMGHASVLTTQGYTHLLEKNEHLAASAEKATRGKKGE